MPNLRKRLAFAGLLLAGVLAGCYDEQPAAEHEVAIWSIELSGGSTQRQFEIAGSEGYWRTDLAARSQEAVRFEATGPDGSRHNSTAGEFPFTHYLRVQSPAPGTWNLTIHATKIVDGTLRIMVPD